MSALLLDVPATADESRRIRVADLGVIGAIGGPARQLILDCVECGVSSLPMLPADATQDAIDTEVACFASEHGCWGVA